MLFADYIEQVAADAIEAIERGDYDDRSDIDDVMDDMWTDDGITGNGSGSYTFNTWKAQEYVKDLLFDDEFVNECEGLCIDMGDLLKQGAESIDVTARCLALGYARDDIEQAWNERHPVDEEDAA